MLKVCILKYNKVLEIKLFYLFLLFEVLFGEIFR